jgi:hypothetical protein
MHQSEESNRGSLGQKLSQWLFLASRRSVLYTEISVAESSPLCRGAEGQCKQVAVVSISHIGRSASQNKATADSERRNHMISKQRHTFGKLPNHKYKELITWVYVDYQVQSCNNNNNLNEIVFQFTIEPCLYIHTAGYISKNERGGNVVRMDGLKIQNISLVGSLFIYWRMARCLCKEMNEKDVKLRDRVLFTCSRP